MTLADQLNVPEWKVYVEALVTLVIPILIATIFRRSRQQEDE